MSIEETSSTPAERIRNIAIIAHVDHGKTTLVDAMLRQTGTFGEREAVVERVLDSGELERERGITILAKNTAVRYRDHKINVVDTPGHADFGGEVERILTMVDGCLLVVDAAEGPMPQTRYVLRKALEVGLKPIVVVNKVDRPDARPHEVVDETLELFMDLGATDDQIDFPVVFASAKRGVAGLAPEALGENLVPLLDLILQGIPAPAGNAEGPLRMLVTTLDYDEYLGRIAIGRIAQGRLESPGTVAISRRDGRIDRGKVTRLFVTEGLKRVPVTWAGVGEIVSVAGMEDLTIGETLTDIETPQPLPVLRVDEPTLIMTFRVNDSPFAGREGTYVTSRHLRDRLMRELERNVSLRVEETDSPDAFRVSGRGELHLGILLETMRREGYELQVSKPEVILREIDGAVHEPLEEVVIDVPSEYVGVVMEHMGVRRGELRSMLEGGGQSQRLVFEVPMRGLIGFRSQLLTDTRGYGTMHQVFSGYGPYRGEIPGRNRGSLVASEEGLVTTYALHALEDRGVFFVGPMERVYRGQVVGEYTRENDIEVNVCKKKHVTNVRSATGEETLRISPARRMGLEACLDFIAVDELLEVTPHSLRIRKAILDPVARARQAKETKRAAR